MELPKKYDPKVEEPKWQKFWEEKGIFKFDENSDKPVFSIDTPPPYASADHLHVGHGMHYSQFEFVARFQRMMGKNVFFPMGYDDNGLPTERFVEKKYNINKSKTTRAEFTKLCLEETQKTGKTYYELFNALGFSIDWDLLYQTIGKSQIRIAQKSFLDLHRKGRLERTDYPTTWCVTCQTTIAQADFENVDMTSHFNDIVFKSGGKDLIIATTRPELLPACVGLFFNPEDERYKDLKGKFAKVPIFGHEVPIMTDDTVDKEKGTGLMMVCTFGDKEDIEKWHKYNLPLKIVFDEDGRLNDNTGKFAGMKIKEARKAIREELRESGALINEKDISHAVNVHERCGTEVEFLKKPQWQIKVLDKKEELIEMAQKINWYPEFMKVRYEHWVQNLQWNWAISRQRYYGVPFPVWYCNGCSAVLLPVEEQLPVDPREEKYKGPECECGSKDVTPEMDVMDTWMISSCTPEINAKWGAKDERKDFMPMSLRPQAHDIIRTWAFYTIVKSYFHHDRIPWNDIMISGHGQDPRGQKMSKSKGNFIVAQDAIAKYSSDAFRFWSASVKLGDDLPYKEKDLLTGQKMVTKLWNASKFGIMHLEDFDPSKEPELEVIDKWVLSHLQKLIKQSTETFEKYEYSKTKSEAEKFFWNTICDNYLEICKYRLYNPDQVGEKSRHAAQWTLYQLILSTLKMFAPIMPHITEAVYQLYFAKAEGKESIHISDWPKADDSLIDEDAEKAGELAIDVLGTVRKFKSENAVSLKTPIKLSISCTEEQKDFLSAVAEDLKASTRAEYLTFGAGDRETEKFGLKLDIEIIKEDSK